MNSLLKALLKETMDLYAAGKAAVGKQWTGVFSALIQAGEDVPSIVANWPDLKAELEALMSNPAADSDLLAYAIGLVGGESVKAQAVIAASADLLLTGAVKIEALHKALSLQPAPAAAPAPAQPAS